MPVKINALQRNFQPTINADASIIVHTTSQNDLWEEDDIVVVNDPDKALAAPEQFTSIVKNNDHSLTVKGKVTTLQIRTFPNPFQGDIILEMTLAPGEGTVFILYDISGRLIKKQLIVSTKTNIRLANLPSATYIYQVIDGRKKLISSG
ncbi:MAG: T9SS type A sorting domain-containing protein [Bacteroidota bacterium]